MGALCCLGCDTAVTYPGNEVMGTFAFEAPLLTFNCQFPEVPDAGLAFDAVLSRNRGTNNAFRTINGYSRPATFDGQIFETENAEPRQFTDCAACDTRLIETMRFALLSRSQSSAVAEACPGNPLDGGVPAENADAGITAPGSTSSGFDAVRACGVLLERVEGTQFDGGACDAKCTSCTWSYRLQGVRR